MPGHPLSQDGNFGLYPSRRYINLARNYAWMGMDSGFLGLPVGQSVLSAPGISSPTIPN